MQEFTNNLQRFLHRMFTIKKKKKSYLVFFNSGIVHQSNIIVDVKAEERTCGDKYHGQLRTRTPNIFHIGRKIVCLLLQSLLHSKYLTLQTTSKGRLLQVQQINDLFRTDWCKYTSKYVSIVSTHRICLWLWSQWSHRNCGAEEEIDNMFKSVMKWNRREKTTQATNSCFHWSSRFL